MYNNIFTTFWAEKKHENARIGNQIKNKQTNFPTFFFQIDTPEKTAKQVQTNQKQLTN